MKKIHIIILAAAGILSFAGAFGVTSFVKKNQSDVLGDMVDSQQDDTDMSDDPQATQTMSFPAGSQTPLKKRMQEDELRNLIVNVRETMEEHKYREKDIASQEERIFLISSARTSLFLGATFFESLTLSPSSWLSLSKRTPATTMGPITGPLPASSIPQIIGREREYE